jgi:hypothetical protein
MKVIRKIHGITILIIALFFCSNSAYAQLEQDYRPIELKGEIPADFLKRVKGDIKLNYQNSLRLSNVQKEQFRVGTEYTLRDIFQQGNIYFNDPMTDYVRKVGDNLLYGTDLANDITFFVSRYNVTNATTWQDGTIIVNIGLIARLENEAQLAFALAHEISHYIQQHPYLQYGRFVKKQQEENKNNAFVQNMDRTLDYELEADSIAINLLKKAKYNYNEGEKVLRIVRGDYEHDAISFVTYLSSDKFRIQEINLCKPISYRDYMENEAVGSKFLLSLNIRQRQLIRYLSGMEVQMNLKDYILAEDLFSKIQSIARFELVEQAFQSSNYLRSVYEALSLLNDFPKNKYLNIKIAENLYYINSYKDLSIIDRIFFDQKKIEDDVYADFCCFINKLTKEDMRKMVFGFVQKQYQSYPSDERMLIIMAKTVETIYDIKYAKSYYEKYVKLYVDGEHFLMAKKKLEKVNDEIKN